MKYGIMSTAMLLTLVFAPLNAMAAKVTSGGEGEVIRLNEDCFECLVKCAKNRIFGPQTYKDCAEVVCGHECKTSQ